MRILLSIQYRYIANHLYLYVTNYFIFQHSNPLTTYYVPYSLSVPVYPEIQHYNYRHIWPNQHRSRGPILTRLIKVLKVSFGFNTFRIVRIIIHMNYFSIIWIIVCVHGLLLPSLSSLSFVFFIKDNYFVDVVKRVFSVFGPFLFYCSGLKEDSVCLSTLHK